MLLSIIVVSYNTAQLTLETLTSVLESLKHSSDLQVKTEIIVIDNNSEDDSVKSLKEFKKHSEIPVTIIENERNPGFGKANNQGIQVAKGDLLLFLNSDTIVRDTALERLVETISKSPVEASTATLASHAGELDHLGILAATLLNSDGTPQPQGGSFPTLLALASHMLLLDDLPLIGGLLPSTQHTGMSQRQGKKLGHVVQQDWVGATAMLVKRAMLDEIGDFDDHIFMYGEDVELCMRARHHHWDVGLHSQAFITHYGSASSSSEKAIIGELKGYLYIWAKHKPIWQLGVARSLIKAGCLLRMFIFGTIFGNAAKASTYRHAWENI